MAGINTIKLKALKRTRAFYNWQLERSESLTRNEQERYSVALKSINKIIREKENSGEKEKNKRVTFQKFKVVNYDKKEKEKY